jgi:hypothetical protein
MSAYATVDDLEKRWRTLTPSEQDKAAVLLDDATAMLDAECKKARAHPHEGLLKIVCVDMVKRAMSSPVDDIPATNVQQTAGPYSASLTFANPMGDMYLTKANRKLLGLLRQRIGTIYPAIRFGECDA